MIFKFKVTFPYSKQFFRDYEFKGESSLYKVMEFIQNQLGFVPDMMILFQGLDENGKILHEYGLFDMGDGSIDNVTVADTQKRGETVLRFVFNLSKNLYLDLSFVGTGDVDARTDYPQVTGEKGHAPQQFSSVYVDDDYENHPHGLPHPVEGDELDDEDEEDEEDEDDEDDEDDEMVFDKSELPEGME